jgi:hypothetical protein
MKKLLKLSLATMAIAALAACGGGGADEPADKYVGTWIGKCASYTGNDGGTYYRKIKRTISKINGGQLNATSLQEGAYSDAACGNKLTSNIYTYSDTQYNIGKTVTVLGVQADEISSINTVTKAAYPGFMTVANSQWYIATYDPSKGETTIRGWSSNSPYTKQ